MDMLKAVLLESIIDFLFMSNKNTTRLFEQLDFWGELKTENFNYLEEQIDEQHDRAVELHSMLMDLQTVMRADDKDFKDNSPHLQEIWGAYRPDTMDDFYRRKVDAGGLVPDKHADWW